jgi:PST family polysaccharide transporter
MLLESILWLFITRGQSGRLLKLLLIISPLMIASFAIGLPFGITWVAVALSVFLLVGLPWILKFAFSGTTLTLSRLAGALSCPILVAVTGAVFAESAMYLVLSQGTLAQLVVAALTFAIIYSLAFLIPAVRKEIISFWKLFSELRLSRQAAL